MADKLTHHELIAEWVDDSQGRAIMLTQHSSGYDEPDTVLVDPWQLRAVCERFGIIASDQRAAKTIAILTRRLKLLNERIGHLAHYLANHCDQKHADLSYEQTYATATADIAEEFCAELESLEACKEPTPQAPDSPQPMAATSARQMSMDV